MTLSTAFTELFDLEHPIALAPMGGTAGGALASAVAEGGGLGLLGSGSADPDWIDRETRILKDVTTRPWGMGLLTWTLDRTKLAHALSHQPAAVMLSFGDPTPYVEPVRDAGAKLILQVTDLEEARQALDVGADVIVAQGTESGGHGGWRSLSTLPLVPMVVDLAGSTPVLAAGGIADGRGLAAVLALGAAGALIGTRFQATLETLADPAICKALVESTGEDTELSSVLDIVRGAPWPEKYPGRTLGHPYLDEWRGRERELAGDQDAKQAYQDGIASGALPPNPVWAGEAVGLIRDLRSARELVGEIAEGAEYALATAGGRR